MMQASAVPYRSPSNSPLNFLLVILLTIITIIVLSPIFTSPTVHAIAKSGTVEGKMREGEKLVLTWNEGKDFCEWWFGMRINIPGTDKWVNPLTGDEHFSKPGKCDPNDFLESVKGFEIDMAKTVGQAMADWEPWKAGFAALKAAIQALIAN